MHLACLSACASVYRLVANSYLSIKIGNIAAAFRQFHLFIIILFHRIVNQIHCVVQIAYFHELTANDDSFSDIWMQFVSYASYFWDDKERERGWSAFHSETKYCEKLIKIKRFSIEYTLYFLRFASHTYLLPRHFSSVITCIYPLIA